MTDLVDILFLLVVVIVCFQLYAYAVTRTGLHKQQTCQGLGIAFCTFGMVSFVFRTPAFIFGGLLLIMLGLRLIANGLDRMNKSIFIDRYSDDE